MPLLFCIYRGRDEGGAPCGACSAFNARCGGLLTVNGQFCGPVDGGGQTFPAARDAEIFIEYMPLAQSAADGAGAGFGRGNGQDWNPRAATRSSGRTA